LEAVGEPDVLIGNQAILDDQFACGAPCLRMSVRILQGIPFGPRAIDSLSPSRPEPQDRMDALL